jgi:hypothetical protein
MRGVAERLDLLHHLAHMEHGRKRLDLLDKIVDEPLRRDFGETGNIVDRFLGVKLGALAAGLRQDVDQMALDVEETQLEHREKAGRPRADDDDVGLDALGHRLNPAWRG